jgi:BirA family transcriptional regulator, biotin operon repressor / biotin---[acetyl-CoA-carboxylase] ligase
MIPPVDASARRHSEERASGAIDPAEVARLAGLERSQVEVVAKIGSTNDVLMARPFQGDVLGRPCVLIAIRQTAGRGRRGRSWLSDPAGSLTLSVALSRRVDPRTPMLAGLPLALGVALAEYASRFADGVALKWPNDLLVRSRKVAGILVESKRSGDLERVVAGVGLNLRLPARLAEALDQPAAGLFDGVRDAPSRTAVAGELVAALIAAIERFFDEGLGETVARWRPFDALAGREVEVVGVGGSSLSGRAEGIDGAGALRIRAGGCIVPVIAGDVSVRARPERRA